MLHSLAKYIKIALVLLFVLPFLIPDVSSQQQQACSPATRERTRFNSSHQHLLTNLDHQIEPTDTPTALSRTAVGSHRISRVDPHVSDLIPFGQAGFHQVATVLGRCWSLIRQYNTRDFSENIFALYAFVSSGARFIKTQYYDTSVAYCDRTFRYLKAAREYEESLLSPKAGQSDDSNQPDTRSLSLRPSRETIVDMIATRADLRSGEVTYLALVLETGVRRIERWSHGGVSLSMRMQIVWGYLSGQNLWQFLRKRIELYSWLAVVCLIGGTFLGANGPVSLFLAGLFFIIGLIYLP